jgi:CBS domain containing-hemolysin-like protein
MKIFTLVILFLVVVKLVVFASIKPSRGKEGNRSSRRYETMMPYALTAQTVLVALLLVVAVLLSVATFDWLLGTVVAVIIALEYAAIAKLGFVHKFSQKLFERHESQVYDVLNKIKPYMKFLKSTNIADLLEQKQLSTKADLVAIVNASSLLSPDEKSLIVNGIEFQNKKVKDVMTSRGKVVTIDKSEFLGPLTLDELHKNGHSRLPVINNDIDHVVGILYLHDLLALDVKKSSTAEKIMEAKVHYIHQDQTLEHALAAFLKTKHHLFVVIDQNRETRGIITLNDTMQALLGREIKDEFDSHTNINSVSKREAILNNTPKDFADV